MANVNFLDDLAEPVSNDTLRREDHAARAAAKKAAPTSVDDQFFAAVDGPQAESAPVAAAEPEVPAVVTRMRAIIGAERVQVTLVPVYMGESEEPAVTVGLRMLSRHDHEWVARAFVKHATNDRHARMLLDTVTVAASIATFDQGPVTDVASATPVWKFLGVVPETRAHVRDPLYPHISVRAACAELMFQVLDDSMNEFVVSLVEAYNSLPSVGRVKPTKDKPEDKPAESNKNPTTRGS